MRSRVPPREPPSRSNTRRQIRRPAQRRLRLVQLRPIPPPPSSAQRFGLRLFAQRRKFAANFRPRRIANRANRPLRSRWPIGKESPRRTKKSPRIARPRYKSSRRLPLNSSPPIFFTHAYAQSPSPRLATNQLSHTPQLSQRPTVAAYRPSYSKR